MNEDIKRVALYIRVSTDKQAKEGDSLDAQENALKEYCKNKNYIIVDEYIDGGESGQKFKRTNLQRMLSDVKKGKIDLILMTKLDRWFRNIGDFYKVIEIIKANNTDWKTIWEDYDTTTASGEFWLNMSLSMGQLEAKRTSERINETFDYKYNVQKTACTGSIPYGYKISNEKKLIIDEEKKERIIELYKYYAKSNNLRKTTKWFSDNYETRSQSTIRKYLINPAYIGKYKRTKTNEIVENYSPPIIDEELWNKVQMLIKINIKKSASNPDAKYHNSKDYIFSGLLRCKICGKTLNGKNNTSGKHYYNCSYHSQHKCENKKCVREEWIEEYLLKEIIPTLQKKKLEIIEINSQDKKIKDNRKNLKKKLNKLTTLFVEDMIDHDYYKEQYNLLKEQLTRNEQDLHKEEKIDYSYIDNFLNSDFTVIYNNLENKEKRRLWASIIKYVELKGYEEVNIIV